MQFSAAEWLRYTRHIQLPQVGVEGQARLKDARVIIIGAGGLGSPVSLYLAAAGIGEITLVDQDEVDLSNLQRQILFRQEDIGKNKAAVGAEHLRRLNPEIRIHSIEQALTPKNAEDIIKNADIVLDCTDNFATRYLINDTCSRLKQPWIYASIHQFSGQCSLFSKKTGCFRCLFPDYPDNIDDCNSAGVIGVLPGMLGTIQANEAIKYICNLDTTLEGSLLLVDALNVQTQKIKLSSSPDCICCSINKKDAQELERDYCVPPCKTTVDEREISVEQYLELKNEKNAELLDVRSGVERKSFNLGGLHIPLDQLEARSNEIERGTAVVCYCQSGSRSSDAARELEKIGIEAFSIEGGIINMLRSEFLG